MKVTCSEPWACVLLLLFADLLAGKSERQIMVHASLGLPASDVMENHSLLRNETTEKSELERK